MSESDSTTPAATPTITAAGAREFLTRPNTAPDERVSVTIPGGAVTITDSAETLFRAVGPKEQLFYRGGVVVEVVNTGETVEVQPLDAVSAQSRFEKYARFYKMGKQGGVLVPQPTIITESIAKQYIKSEACRDLLPKLNGILHCPLLVERDNALHRMHPGYNAGSGFYVRGAGGADTVPLEEAVALLKGLLKDYDFLSPGDRSRAIASLITPALKLGGLIRGSVPVDVAEANDSQSGKSYRQKIIAALYNQELAIVTKKSGGGVGSMEETFNEHLIKGRVFIQFDNMRGRLDSQYLEAFLTANGPITARIPYHGNVTIDPSKFIIFISSNGFESTKDLSNRASIIRIRKRENYHYPTFGGMDLLQFTFHYQPMLLGAVFAIIEEWHRQGKPRTNETRHDFREWCQILDWIIQYIFHEAPLMDGHEGAKERSASPQLTFLREVAILLARDGKMGIDVSASDIADAAIEADREIPGQSPEKQIGRSMGSLMGGKTELVFDDYRIIREERWELNQAGNNVKNTRYRFSTIGSVA